MRAPLEGIKIVDLTSAVVGPYATQILADYGAEVVKLEQKDGDIIRWIAGRSPNPGMSGKFLHLNRNKRGLSVDLKQPAGKVILGKLIAGCDIFLHNMRTDAIERLGFDYPRALTYNPNLIYCGVVGFGQSGPYRARPAYDSILQGGTGLASLFAANGGEPRYVPFVVVDRVAGLMVVHTLMAALLARSQDPGPRQIEIPMFENFAALVMSEHLAGSTFMPPLSPPGDLRLLDANAKPVQTADGYICVTTNTNAQVAAMFDAFGMPDLKADARFNSASARIEHIKEFFELRARVINTDTTANWLRRLMEYDVPVMQAHTLESLMDDEHIRAVNLLKNVEHPTEGKIYEIGIPTKMTGFTPSVRRQAPWIGRDTREVLSELGYGLDEIDRLEREGVVFSSAVATNTA